MGNHGGRRANRLSTAANEQKRCHTQGRNRGNPTACRPCDLGSAALRTLRLTYRDGSFQTKLRISQPGHSPLIGRWAFEWNSFQFSSSRDWHAADLGTTQCSNPSQSSVASFVLQGSTAVFSPSSSFDRWPATPIVGYATHQERRRFTSWQCGTSAISFADRFGAGHSPPHLVRARLFAMAGPGGVSLVPNHPVAQARF